MRKTKFLFLLCLFGMIGIGASAYDFKVDGIIYNTYLQQGCHVKWKIGDAILYFIIRRMQNSRSGHIFSKLLHALCKG